MHDPKIVAFEIRRPWPQRSSFPARDSARWRIRLHHDHGHGCGDDPPHRDGPFPWWKPSSYPSHMRLAGRDVYWPPMVTVWHQEPGGHDSLTVCGRRTREDGTREYTGRWRWHVHHWRLQFPPLQQLRRRLLTRCAWCGGRSTKTDPVNVAQGWDRARGPWWQGERGLFHMDCSGIDEAHKTCVCLMPITEHETYGQCARCTRFRPFGMTDERLARARELAAIPAGARR